MIFMRKSLILTLKEGRKARTHSLRASPHCLAGFSSASPLVVPAGSWFILTTGTDDEQVRYEKLRWGTGKIWSSYGQGKGGRDNS